MCCPAVQSVAVVALRQDQCHARREPRLMSAAAQYSGPAECVLEPTPSCRLRLAQALRDSTEGGIFVLDCLDDEALRRHVNAHSCADGKTGTLEPPTLQAQARHVGP